MLISEIFKNVGSMTASELSTYISSSITIIATLSGIAIPLGVDITSKNLSPYKDKKVASYFKNELEFIGLISVTFFGLLFFLFLFFLKGHGDNFCTLKLILILLSYWYVVAYLFTFYQYINKVFEYATNTEEIVFNKCKIELNEYLGKL